MWAGFDGIEFDSVDNDGNLLYVENTDALEIEISN